MDANPVEMGHGIRSAEDVDIMTKLLLFDFKTPSDIDGWKSIDDVVMGGCSASRTAWGASGCLEFIGEVSLENDGGFASIRSPNRNYHMAGSTGIGIRVRGDGKRYKFTVRVDSYFDGISYQVPFTTKEGERQDFLFGYERFFPTYHGHDLPGARPLDPRFIIRFGFIVADKQTGPFRLEIESIWAYA